MSCKIKISSKAEKCLTKIPKNALTKINTKIMLLADNPRIGGYKKFQGLSDLYRIRVGHYRIVYTILDKEKLILIESIQDRKDVYKRLRN